MMKKLYFLLLCALLSLVGYSQNVGIGIQTPLVPFHVNNSNSAFEIMRLQSNNSQGTVMSIWNNGARKGYLGLAGNQDDFKLGTYPGPSKLQFVMETTLAAMTILPNGNVGIGTETPSSILEVNGPITFQTHTGIGIEGALRYNGTSFQWHDGNSWQNFGSGGGSQWGENSFGIYFSEANKRTIIGSIANSTPIKFGVFNTEFLETSRIYHKPDASGTEAIAHNIIADAPSNSTYTNYGSKIEMVPNGSGTKYGQYINITQNANTVNPAYGTSNRIRSSGGSNWIFANLNYANSSSTGNSYGSHNYVLGSGTGYKYGVYSIVEGSGTKYGIYSKVTGGGVQYGVYAEAEGVQSIAMYAKSAGLNTGYAGYFAGRIFGSGDVSIGQAAPSPTRLFVQGYAGREILKVRTATGNTKLLVNEAGQVIINSDTEAAAGYALSVDGKIAAEELRIEFSQNWPDYVFADNYNLKTLEEVENHIKEEKHLPGIPSANDIAENGLMVGDMQKNMMEKIEELTLYMIEMNKELKELKTENEAMKLKIEQLEK